MAAAEAWWNKGAAIVLGKKFFRVQIQKEVISDLKRENKFLSKDVWDSIGLISGERCVNRF
jgi:hypothetical protein